MSGVENLAKSPTSSAGKAASQTAPTGKGPKASSSDKAVPRSMPDLPQRVRENPSGDNEGKMVPAAGRINDQGEVVDDDGLPIGKVTGGEASKFAGYIVTQEGDILDDDGAVVGKAEPLESMDNDLLNYTTDSAKNTTPATTTDESQKGVGRGRAGIADAAGSFASGAAGDVGGVKDVKGRTAQGAADTGGAQGVTGAVGDSARGSTEKVAEAATGAAEKGIAADIPSLPSSVANKLIAMFEGPFAIENDGKVTDQNGEVLGKLTDGSDAQELVGKEVKGVDEDGNLLGGDDAVLGKIDIAPEGSMAERIKKEVPEAAAHLNALEAAQKEVTSGKIPSFPPDVAEKVIAMFENPFSVADDGRVADKDGNILGKLAEGQDYESLMDKHIKGVDQNGNLLGDDDAKLGKIDIAPEGRIVDHIKDEIPEATEPLDAIQATKQQTELPDLSILEGLKINKMGNVVDEDGNPLGKIKSGDPKKLAGKTPDKDGKVRDDQGNVIGEVEVLPEAIQKESAPFEEFPDATVDKFGKVIFEDRQVGVVVGDDWQNLIGKKVDSEGDVLDQNGNVIGHAERQEAEEPEEEPGEESLDYSILRDKKVNKLGNVVDDNGQIWGHIVQGILKQLNGKTVGDNGQVFNDAGEVIGQAEPIPDSEREEAEEHAPFEDFPNAVVGDNGDVMFEGEKVGVVVEGDAKKLKGKSVDPDGDILDRSGNSLGRAERWEAESEPEVDMSPLAGKRINKAGNAVDTNGDIYGRVIEGNVSHLVGKACDKNGWIRDESGDVIGKCELISESEREGMKEGPFAELTGCTVNRDGKVVTTGGDIVGRLTSGEASALAGRPVDDDGDICDRNGNVLGHAERWEEPREISPMSGRKVNREGNVVDEDGDVIGKLTTGELSKCAGKKIDNDGDVVDQKGTVIGHCSLLEEIPDPTETDEEREARLKKEQDDEIAKKISFCIEQSLDKIKPICKMIVERIDQEEAKSEDDRDEEALVNQVRPLIEEGGKILTEANGVIRGLDPDGRISAQAKHHAAGREATPEEYHLAELLKELTGTVTETIENAKRKLENMPKAKKGINPLWALLNEPLFQIVAAVGLLLSGVLGLVGNLLNGLGLGGLASNLLGGLGISKVLDNVGIGSILG